jgi:hypothetical protein
MVDGKSVDVRAKEPAEVDADAERIAVKLKRGAPAEVELEIDISNRLVIDASIETIVAYQVCGARRNASCSETRAVLGRATSTAFGGRDAPENPADYRLIPPGRDIISRSREAKIARIIFDPTVELSVVAEGDEGAMEKSSVHDGVAHAGIKERREISKGVVEMVRQIPGGMTGAEALLRVTCRSGEVNGRAVIQGIVGIVQSEVREESANANTGNHARVIFLDGRGRADKVERHAGINSKVARKVESESGCKIVDTPIAAVAAFKSRAHGPAGSEASGVIFCRPGCSGVRGLRKQRSARRKNCDRTEKACTAKPRDSRFQTGPS